MSSGRGRLGRPGSTDLGIGIGVLVAVVGLLAVFTTAVDVTGVVDDQTRAVLGIVGIGLGVIGIRHWVGTDLGGYEPPEREGLRPVHPPGGEVDEVLGLSVRGTQEAAQFYRSQLRDRLKPIAIELLRTRRGLSEEQAREQLREGTWTDDPIAARFFQLGTDGGASDEVTGAFRQPLGGEHPFQERARHAVDELGRLTEVSE